jgi:uncharacterized protein (DUF2062 family)
MKPRAESTSRSLVRSIAMGVLLSMIFFYGIHVFGTWEIENYRPNEETTYTVLLHNKCAVLGNTHTLRPNTDISAMNDSIDGTKLGGSFMNFTDGHVVGMVILSLVLGGIIFAVRRRIQKNQQSKS